MYKEIIYLKPKVYSSKSFFLSCEELLLASYMQSFNISFQWIYSNCWDFCFDNVKHTIDTSEVFKWENLSNMFGITKKDVSGMNLIELISLTAEAKMCLIVFAETKHISQEHNYYHENRSHFYIVQPITSHEKNIKVYSWLPELKKEVDFHSLEKAYVSANSYSYFITPPIKNRTSLLNQLKLCQSQIIGSIDELNISYGLPGIENYILWLSDNNSFPSDSQINNLKELINRRCKFLEFLLFVSNSILVEEQRVRFQNLYNIADKSTEEWTFLRNNLVRNKILHKSQKSKDIARLREIRNTEYVLLETLNDTIDYLEKGNEYGKY